MYTAGKRRKRFRRSNKKLRGRGGSFLNRLMVPAALVVGQSAMHKSRKHRRHRKSTKKGMRRKTARRAYMKK